MTENRIPYITTRTERLLVNMFRRLDERDQQQLIDLTQSWINAIGAAAKFQPLGDGTDGYVCIDCGWWVLNTIVEDPHCQHNHLQLPENMSLDDVDRAKITALRAKSRHGAPPEPKDPIPRDLQT
jgi:hypothetical protein